MGLRFRELRPSSEVLYQTVAGESVLLDLRSQKYFGLNEVGTRAWQLLQETEDTAAVAERLLTEYAVDAVQLERDLDDLFERLVQAGLAEAKAGAKA